MRMFDNSPEHQHIGHQRFPAAGRRGVEQVLLARQMTAAQQTSRLPWVYTAYSHGREIRHQGRR